MLAVNWLRVWIMTFDCGIVGFTAHIPFGIVEIDTVGNTVSSLSLSIEMQEIELYAQ